MGPGDHIPRTSLVSGLLIASSQGLEGVRPKRLWPENMKFGVKEKASLCSDFNHGLGLEHGRVYWAEGLLGHRRGTYPKAGAC